MLGSPVKGLPKAVSPQKEWVLHLCVTVMCHVKTQALPHKHGVVLKLVSNVPQLINARVTLLRCFLMGCESTQVPAQYGNLLPSSPRMPGWDKQHTTKIRYLLK